jgi:dihydrodipicolinate synthase/N-acetylneuraminate lyase
MQDKGIYVANLTPFKNGTLDIAAIRAHIEFLIKAGVRGLCPAGTTGEFLYLSIAEKKQLFSTVIDACARRAEVLCCPWETNTNALADLCSFVSDKGADGIFLPPPIYYSFTDEEIIGFYQFARNQSGIPIYCYNIPKYSNNEIRIPALKIMIDRGLVKGIKDSSANERRIGDIVSLFAGKHDAFAGGDHFVIKAKELGANGFISALGNAYPEPFVALWNTPTDEIQQEINVLRDAIKGYGGIPALKHLMSRRGFSFGCRFPFRELDSEQKRNLDAITDNL